MEHSTPIPRKRKASQSSPAQEHRCISQDDPPAAILHEPSSTPAVDIPSPSPLYAADDPSGHRPKRPRLSLDAPSSLSHATRRPTPPSPKRGSPPPAVQPHPQHHELSQTHPHGQQYLLHRQPSQPTPNRSLLSPLESPATSSPVVVATPQRYVPPLLPPITRETLRELELDSILKNPQLRHDLLFEPCLQFRPTPSRRKQMASERYWLAITRELQDGCGCIAWDANYIVVFCPECDMRQKKAAGRYSLNTKRARPPTPPPWSERYYRAYLEASADPQLDPSAQGPYTEPEELLYTNFPSRIAPMLNELVAVLKLVIVPPPTPSPHTISSSPARLLTAQSASDAQHLLSHFDPALIEQELRRGIFDPAGLFALVGKTLKRHCAPMRDRQVDAMVNVAKDNAGMLSQRVVLTLRSCFEILELMKLDIANHQLQHLRPFLAVSTPDFELQLFVTRCRRNVTSPRTVQVWLQNAWDKVCMTSASSAVAVQRCIKKVETDGIAAPAPRIPLSLREKVYFSLIEGITSLVFKPLASPHLPGSPTTPVGLPETLYLDAARVSLLAADAADLTALYMLLMLWRQLVFWKPASSPAESVSESKSENQNNNNNSNNVFPPYCRDTPRLEDWEVDRVKREIWEVGPRRIGSCFLFLGGNNGDGEDDRVKWCHAMQNVALQIAMRAEEARTRTSAAERPSSTTTRTGRPSTTTPVSYSASALDSRSAITRKPPSQPALDLMSGWIRTHMRRDSALACRFRELLKQEVTHVVSRLTFATSMATSTSTATPTGITPTGMTVATGNDDSETVPGCIGVKATTTTHTTGDSTAPIPASAGTCGGMCMGMGAFIPESGGGTAGLEPLMPEIRHLAQRLAKLVLVNMRVYWSLYEAKGFLLEREEAVKMKD